MERLKFVVANEEAVEVREAFTRQGRWNDLKDTDEYDRLRNALLNQFA